ncbi:MAG TPA: carboxypeptidase-like regulatory domain-containing protein [Candidatus Acidoferrales bacterium]|nr:carboxypeptidase-like regulatory domain-containing protein [Candidatus Acidoferrales bacterium]
MPGIARAQRVQGQISGTVVDPSGAAVPNASLTLTQAAVGFSAVVTSNEAGAYVFPNLLPGKYKLSVDAKGFATAVFDEVTVDAARTTDLKVSLQIGGAAQTVEVSAVGEVLETSTNTLATTVNPDSIQDLPLNGRDILPLAQIVPGAQVGGDLRFTTYNSMPNGAINISVDGTNNNFQRFRTSTTGFFEAAALRLGAIDEVTVSTSDLTADAGAEGAVTLRFTTKHGTNQYHGSGVWEAYNSAFNANSFQNDAFLAAGLTDLGRKQPFHTNDFGGNVGGPILKDKLFFFFNFEFENQPGTGIFTQPVLSSAAQQGLFTYTEADGVTQNTVNLLNIAANAPSSIGGPYPSTVPTSMQSLLSSINTLAANGSLASNTTDPYTAALEQTMSFTAAQNTKQRWPTARIDYNVTHSILWHTSYDLYWRTYPRNPVYAGDPVQLFGFQSSYSTFATGVDWTINPHLVNQVNFGILNTQERAQPGNSFNAFQGIAFLPIAPNIVNVGQAFIPPVPDNASILPEPRNNPVWDLTDNVTWTHGNHTFTFGGDYRYSNQHDVNTQPPIAENLGISGNDPAAAMFNTSNQAPGGGPCTDVSQGCFPGGLSTANNNEALVDAEAMYSILTGRVSSIAGLVPLDTGSKTYKNGGITSIKEKQTVGGFYVQDAWKVNPHLALNYGLRWQFSGALLNTDNYFSSPDIPNFYGPSAALFQPGQLNGVANPQLQLRAKTYNGDYKQPSPNFGFAWNPDFEQGILGKLFGGSNTVIRGGIAINHYDEGWIPWENVSTGSISNQSVSLNPGQFTAGSITFDPTGGTLPSLNPIPASFTLPMQQANLTFTPDGFISTVNPNIRNPYIENWTIGIQRKIGGNWAVEADYVGNHSVHMWAAYDVNEVNIFQNISGFDSFLTEFQNAQVNLGINGGTSFADNTGLPGLMPTPLLDQAFANQPIGTTFQNPAFTYLVQTGQAGTLAGEITGAIIPGQSAPNYVFFCNLVGNTFAPCVTQGYNSNAPTPLAYPINYFQVNPYAGGHAATLLSDPGSESYNGLQLQVKHPFGHGLNFMANYAFSHSFTNRYLGDYFQADGALIDFNTLRNPSYNRVPSPYDLRHTFRTYWTYDLPFGKGKQFASNVGTMLDRAIGGWTIGANMYAQTGRNFKLAGGQNTYNYWDGPDPAHANGTPAGILNYVPNENDSGVALNGMTVSQIQSKVGVYFTGNAFSPVSILPANLFGPGGAIQSESTPGVLGQNVFLKGPRTVDVDLSVIKTIGIWERLRFNIYAEFLNAFNHPSFNFIDGYSFGTNNPAQYLLVNQQPYAPGSVGQNGNRQIQFRLQMQF